MKISILQNGFLEINGGIQIPSQQTKILEAVEYNHLIIVRENYYGFNGSNLYAINKLGNILWYAELPHDSDSYTGNIEIKENSILCTTWNGICCRINPQNGKIISKKVSK
jgi:hypothetical protein